MRQSPTAFERRLLAAWLDRQTLSFTELRRPPKRQMTEH